MSRLLQKQLRVFTIYALVVLACSVPVYFFIVDHIWQEELDEHNQMVAQRTEARFNTIDPAELEQSIGLWNRIQPGTHIVPAGAAGETPDSLYQVIRQNPYAKGTELDRFRGLSTVIHIHGKPYLLYVETNIEETSETVMALAVITCIFFIILALGFVLLNRMLAANIWKPFHRTLAKLREFELNSTQPVQFDASTTLEFQELNNVLDKLIAKNRSVYMEQKEFTENASHELQTPLAVIQSKLDLMLQQDGLTTTQYQLIEEIGKALSRASRINKNLLLLAKIENRQFSDQEKLDLSLLLSDNLSFLSEHIESKDLVVETDIMQQVRITGNKMLVETLVNNLLLNAIRHNHPNGKIIIRLSPGKLTVCNTGIAALQYEGLFKRFGSTAQNGSGSGLGLAIARQICERYNWPISYRFENGLHCFSVNITPAA